MTTQQQEMRGEREEEINKNQNKWKIQNKIIKIKIHK
jgi:hypothetical protein